MPGKADDNKYSMYSLKDEDNDKQKKYKTRENSMRAKEGLVQKRGCTDVLCLWMLIAMWAVLSIVGCLAMDKGDPYRLVSPLNDMGELCGQTGNVKDKPYFYIVLTNSIGVCTDLCPTELVPLDSTDVDDYYCLHTIESGLSDSALSTYIENYCFTGGEFDLTKNCGCNIKRPSTDIFHRCLFDQDSVRKQYVAANSNSYFVDFITDIYSVRNVIFGFGFAFSFLLCCVWCVLLSNKYIGYLMCWSCILIIMILLAVVCGIAYQTANEWERMDPPAHEGREIQALRYFSAIMLALSILFACLMVYLRKAINLSVKIISLSAHALEDMPLLVFTPAIQVFGFILFLIPFFVFLIYTASYGTYEQQYVTAYAGTPAYEVTVFQPGEGVPARLWFYVGCFLWTMNFCAMIGSLVIALSVAIWYFTLPTERSKKVGNGTICRAYGIILRYHMGTVAVGAFLVALVQFIRVVVAYIERKSKKVKDNLIVKYVFCCINCLLLCLEKFLKFVSKNAYIQTAIHGTNFFSSCKAAFYLIARNVVKIGTVHLASTAALIVGKIFVVVASGACAYYVLTENYQDKANGFIAPVILVMLLALSVVTMFMDVFHMVIDTILMCLLTDEECREDGVPIYATTDISEFVKQHGMSEQDKQKYFQKSSDVPVGSPEENSNAAKSTELTKSEAAKESL